VGRGDRGSLRIDTFQGIDREIGVSSPGEEVKAGRDMGGVRAESPPPPPVLASCGRGVVRQVSGVLGEGRAAAGVDMGIFTNAAAAASIVLPSFGDGRSQTTETGRRNRLKPLYLALPVVLIALAIAAWFWISRQSSIQVATAWGLPGVWQHDCEAPVRADNPRYSYSIEDGKILLRRDFGRGMKDTSEISDVEKTSAGELHYVVHFVQLGQNRQDRASRQNVLAKSADGRARAVSNKDTGTGVESVVGGVRAEDKNPTPWMSRCRQA
jgi:hypothetical protein